MLIVSVPASRNARLRAVQVTDLLIIATLALCWFKLSTVSIFTNTGFIFYCCVDNLKKNNVYVLHSYNFQNTSQGFASFRVICQRFVFIKTLTKSVVVVNLLKLVSKYSARNLFKC